MTVSLSPGRLIKGISKELPSALQSPNYIEAEQHFIQLLASESLDQQVNVQPEQVNAFEAAIVTALTTAYAEAIKADDIE